ncbi:unnamed protein product [Ixodes persulcatus]
MSRLDLANTAQPSVQLCAVPVLPDKWCQSAGTICKAGTYASPEKLGNYDQEACNSICHWRILVHLPIPVLVLHSKCSTKWVTSEHCTLWTRHSSVLLHKAAMMRHGEWCYVDSYATDVIAQFLRVVLLYTVRITPSVSRLRFLNHTSFF